METTRCRRTAVIGGVALAAVCAAGSAVGAAANPIIIQPNPVAPGGTISVFDGGNCDFPSTGTVTFTGGGSVAIPSIRISPLQNMIGGTGPIPAKATPGTYQVSLTCTTSGGHTEGPFTGTLKVASGASSGVNPTGGAKTGDGASLTTPGGLAEGIALVLIGGGAWLFLRKRRASA
ncbi:hypothetical protein KDK95_10590 [Actinospica sp. MGRD01-02]|uniref:LPXTG cell wall anchor domain-containing protein n=1 Tax=Actinospica acidithermotolerans TaxID=2828514 RepID=A0A941EAM0_9ACTN|nr:hypothetical protein [Actinospica acidithermotolerans]MBR7826750.1 hypothetical protein [Actinospica acidithermotolerans]